MIFRYRKQRGDTLVEVLLATVILSVVLSSAYALANRATRFNQAGYERTEVANIIQAQGEYLRAVRSYDKPRWNNIWSRVQTADSGFNCASVANFGSFPSPTGAFHLVTSGSGAGTVIEPQDGVLVQGNYRVWVRAKQVAPGVADFSVNACWDGLGSDANNFAGIVLRLQREGS